MENVEVVRMLLGMIEDLIDLEIARDYVVVLRGLIQTTNVVEAKRIWSHRVCVSFTWCNPGRHNGDNRKGKEYHM